MLVKRTNILFNQILWEQLALLAKTKKSSVGKLIRNAVTEYYDLQNDTTAKIRKACQAIEIHRKYVKKKIDYKALINYGREI